MQSRSIHCALVALALAFPVIADAHGFAGKRFFPATLATEDPFVADELSLPTVLWQKMPGEGDAPGTRETHFSTEFAKRITENLGVGIGTTYKIVRPDAGDTQRGFDNLEVHFKYAFYRNDAHEAIVSAGIDWDIGGTGARRVGAESFSTITPAVFFGKGLGDLSDDMKWLRPVAITGQIGIGFPTRSSTTGAGDDDETATKALVQRSTLLGSRELRHGGHAHGASDGDGDVERHPHTLDWAFSIQYSLPYLQSFVQDVGLKAPFNRMIPVVEFAMSTALDRGASGTTGTVNPGIIWAGQNIQLAIEAVIPINRRSGDSVGVLAQLHFFLDDLFPQTLGRPMIR
ncbi:MAG TPA: hypothetical protein VFS06_15580 [Casimicrobiaceae bacterium]|nr:hypothetical protein [Casimicrobiaceae bacterium]